MGRCSRRQLQAHGRIRQHVRWSLTAQSYGVRCISGAIINHCHSAAAARLVAGVETSALELRAAAHIHATRLPHSGTCAVRYETIPQPLGAPMQGRNNYQSRPSRAHHSPQRARCEASFPPRGSRQRRCERLRSHAARCKTQLWRVPAFRASRNLRQSPMRPAMSW